MHCPACQEDVDIADGGDARHAYVNCPHPACGQELVLAQGESPRLLDATLAKREAEEVVRREKDDEPAAQWVVAGIAAAIVFVAFVFGGSPIALILILAGFVFVIVGGVGIAIAFEVVRRRRAVRWMRTLPRATVKLTAHPKGYRA